MLKKSIYIILIILLVPSMFVGCAPEGERQEVSLEESMKEFTEALAKENLDGMYLEVYHIKQSHPKYLITTVEDLLGTGDNDISVRRCFSNEDLLENISLLEQIKAENFTPVNGQADSMDANVCFLFRDKNEKPILQIIERGYSEGKITIFINGFEVEINEMYFAFTIPFLPYGYRKSFVPDLVG